MEQRQLRLIDGQPVAIEQLRILRRPRLQRDVVPRRGHPVGQLGAVVGGAPLFGCAGPTIAMRIRRRRSLGARADDEVGQQRSNDDTRDDEQRRVDGDAERDARNMSYTAVWAMAGRSSAIMPPWRRALASRFLAPRRPGVVCEHGLVNLTIDIDIDQLPEPKADELGRILRYWGGTAKQLDLSAPLEQLLLDSSYQPVGVLKVS